jgi:hypothetical protein
VPAGARPGAAACAETGIGYAGWRSHTANTAEAPPGTPGADLSGADSVTVLTTQGPLATKRIIAVLHGPPKIEPYGSAKFFSLRQADVSNIDELAALLGRLEKAPRSFIIRGRPRDGTDYRRVLRRVRDRRNSDGTVTPSTIEPAARHWIPLDCDRIACPDWLDPFDEPDQIVEHVVSRLPSEFHDATVWWQFTSSQGIKPGISLRLFFWSDRPLADWELKQWLADSPTDPSVFAPAQPIYVARPLFVGMPDPVPFRSGIWRGDRDAVAPPEIKKLQTGASAPAREVFTGGGGRGYEFHCNRIGDHNGGDGFFAPVKSAVAAWVGRHGAAADAAWLRADLERAIRTAARDPTKHDDAYIEFRIGDLDPLIAAIRELQAAREAEPVERCEPTYPAPLGSVAEARAKLEDAMDRFVAAALEYLAAAPPTVGSA